MENKQIEAYFESISSSVNGAYAVAEKARATGIDPENKVGIPLAKNMAERVEGLVGALVPQIIGSGLSKRIQELEDKYGKLDLRVALVVAMEVVREQFCQFDSKVKAMEAGIRVGLAYLTLGVVSSPLEGFVELRIQKRRDGKEYFSLMYSGPIRSAGGTAGALSVVLADYIRKESGYDVYDPTEEEVKRTVAELYDYHDRVTNLQYLPSEEEIQFIAKNIPVQINGDPSEKIEVSNYKDLPRIETNRIRSGFCLVMGECIAQKAAKIWKILNRGPMDLGLEQWSFLQDFLSLQKKVKAKDTGTSAKITPVYTYIADLVAGRPVLTHPLAPGGFRLRYGRARTTGYSATAIHPATMFILNKYIGIGTQIKMERPGKASSVTSCDTIDGPIVQLNDGSILQLNTLAEAKQYNSQIKEMLFLGDVLVSYGDFFNRAHSLVPAGYCPEWWIQELQAAAKERFGDDNPSVIAQKAGIEEESIAKIFADTLTHNISAEHAVLLSKKLAIPLHPYFTVHWGLADSSDFVQFYGELQKILQQKKDEEKLVFPINDKLQKMFAAIGLEHTVVNNEFLVVEQQLAYVLESLFGHEADIQQLLEQNTEDDKPTLTLVNKLSPIRVRDKSGIFIGARMGRPEKAKMRKLTGNPHCLFPVGEEGGRLRSFQSTFDAKKITAEFPLYHCKNCNKSTIFGNCIHCGNKTEKRYYCKECGLLEEDTCKHGTAATYTQQSIDIGEYFGSFMKNRDIGMIPDLIKGVKGTSNREHVPEHFAKGVFRAKHDVCVNKDGTTRYDMTQLPITHFKPKEIQTSVERLHELGYATDIEGNELIDDNQVVELMPQDIVLPACDESPELGADQILLKTGRFVDEILTQLYGQEPFYNYQSTVDIAGALVAVLAPHTSAASVGRVIGFSKTQGFFAHPLLHAATRRDCDGDEASVSLLMDVLLNFSKQYLPDTRGATQDAPLVLTSHLVPAEVDDMAFDLDVDWKYSLEFYQACEEFKKPWEVKVPQFGERLDTEKQYYGLGFTHGASDINEGVRCSAYKILPSMQEKLTGQMDLADRIRAVDQVDVARLVIEKHLIRDIRGNLRKFSMQQFRCSICNTKYRRPPLVGHCTGCPNGNIIFTITQGSIVKYLEPAISLAKKYDLPNYLKQSLEITKRNVESLFGKEKEKQVGLGEWF